MRAFARVKFKEKQGTADKRTRLYDATEWQSFSQKKDIEEIVKNTKAKENIKYLGLTEICIAVISMLSDVIREDFTRIYKYLNYILFIAAVIVVALIIIIVIKEIYEKNKSGSDRLNPNDAISLFDNEICYYALMADSYFEIVSKNNAYRKSNIYKFYYIEACFYITKAIYNLSCTEGDISDVYSNCAYDIHKYKKVALTRVKNICGILDEGVKNIRKFYVIMDGKDDFAATYKELMETYIKEYENFKIKLKGIK